MKKLLEKTIFKVVTSDKVVTSEKILSNTKNFNCCFFNNIKDPDIKKIYRKRRPVVHVYNNEKKNIMLEHSSKIPRVS